jgi:MYXO-CTERM domain-containing protein
VGDQDIAFLNDIQTTAGGEDVLQPVLDFSEIPGHWAIESEHCCIAGNDEQSNLVQVSLGDTILGVVTATGCDATGVCASWTVTTTDTTTGKSTVLNTTAPMGVPNSVNPAALETYGVMSCDMFPASGEETFIDNTLRDPDGGGVQTLRYGLDVLSSPPAGFVSCGYGGSMSNNTYTLIFSTSPMGSDAGVAVDGGSSIDASVDGSDGGPRDAAEEDGASGVDASAPTDSAIDASLDSSADTSGSGALASPDAGAIEGGAEVVPGLDSGSNDAAVLGSGASEGGVSSGVDAGSFVVDSSTTDGGASESASSAGCGCSFAGVDGRSGAGPLGLLLLVGARRRRLRTRRSAL